MPKNCESSFQLDLNNDTASGTGSASDSMYREDQEDSDFDEATFNSNFNGATRDILPPPVKINGNKLEVIDDSYDAVSEQSRNSEYVAYIVPNDFIF